MHVLVVDDDDTVRSSLRDALATAGVRVSTAASGREALERIAADPVDLVLADVRMPGMIGLELLRRVRAGARVGAPAAHVVLMTACDDPAIAVTAAREGARAFLNKPLDLAELRALVSRLLGERAPAGAGQSPVP
jgi:DNA-binding NtrC family response regulator